MPGLMSSELFPPNSRAFCKVGSINPHLADCECLKVCFIQGLSRSLSLLLMVGCLKLFPLLQASLHLWGTFYLCCGLVLAALPLVWCSLPETKDVAVTDINNMFREDTDRPEALDMSALNNTDEIRKSSTEN